MSCADSRRRRLAVHAHTVQTELVLRPRGGEGTNNGKKQPENVNVFSDGYIASTEDSVYRTPIARCDCTTVMRDTERTRRRRRNGDRFIGQIESDNRRSGGRGFPTVQFRVLQHVRVVRPR